MPIIISALVGIFFGTHALIWFTVGTIATAWLMDS